MIITSERMSSMIVFHHAKGFLRLNAIVQKCLSKIGAMCSARVDVLVDMVYSSRCGGRVRSTRVDVVVGCSFIE